MNLLKPFDKFLFHHSLPVLLASLLIGCSFDGRRTSDGAPSRPIDVSSIPNAVPKVEPITRAGNPPVYEVLGKRYQLMKESRGYVERGIASWYGTKFHGRTTSNGERYNMYAMTAAHKTIPIPAYLKVTNLENQRSVIVRVNDRGPFHGNRIIDLSYAAAAKLDILKKGTGFVEIRAIDPAQPVSSQKPTQPPPGKEAKKEGIYIQVGAFGQHANALRLSRQIHAAKLAGVRIHTEKNGNAPLYRVQVGPLKSAEEADTLNNKLSQLGILETKMIAKPVSNTGTDRVIN